MTKQRLNNLHVLALATALAVAALGIPGAHAQYADLHDFDTPSLASPQYPGILAQGRDGNLYGTAPLGGNIGFGGVFRFTPYPISYSVISSFDSTMANPDSGLTLGSDGNFYGATLGGSVFQITPVGAVTVLHNFVYLDGISPYAPPIQGTDGNFYGVTSAGGIGGFGTVYKITAGGVFTVLYRFDNTHGSTPIAPLIQATDGNFYGTTKVGGTFGFGTAFKITPAGTLTVLYNFDSTHGSNVFSPLVQGTDGNFYGTTRNGGTKNGGGVVFKLTAKKQLTVLYNFDATGATKDGSSPYAGLVQANDGQFYGVTSAGGTNGAGTLYTIDSNGVYSKLFDFVPATGSFPTATLIQQTFGTLYGVATSGGLFGHGALFSFKPNTGLLPFVIALPTSGLVSQPVGILGDSLSDAKSVTFNGQQAVGFTIVSNSYLTADVPDGATTGLMNVCFTFYCIPTKQNFRVIPVVLSFSPSSGPVGTPVVITGNSFTGATKVTFGGVKATVFSVDSYVQITATVPAGAVTGKIQVTTPGGTASSATAFTVTH